MKLSFDDDAGAASRATNTLTRGDGAAEIGINPTSCNLGCCGRLGHHQVTGCPLQLPCKHRLHDPWLLAGNV